jgi:4-hydroxybenzoate polyprenyltransferase
LAAALTAAALLIAIADLALVVACWKRRTVLGAVLGATGVPLVGVAIARGASRGAGEDSILIAGLMLGIGAVLYTLGRVLERALEDPDDDGHD